MVNVAPTPHKEQPIDATPLVDATQPSFIELPEQLAPLAFQERFNCVGGNYSQACNAGGRSGGFKAADGSVWSYGGKKNKVWSSCPVATTEAETRVLSIV